MVGPDLEYVERLLTAGKLRGPVLELGADYEWTCQELVRSFDLDYTSTDLQGSVDVVADFERVEDMRQFDGLKPFATILALNVLEHTFDPIRVLDNARSLLAAGGHLVLVTPAVWPLHAFPIDVWRLMPQFYEEYAKRRGLRLLPEWFEYVGRGPVRDHGDALPTPWLNGSQRLRGKIVHRLFRTFGRGMFHPSHVGVAVLLQVPSA